MTRPPAATTAQLAARASNNTSALSLIFPFIGRAPRLFAPLPIIETEETAMDASAICARWARTPMPLQHLPAKQHASQEQGVR